MLELEKTSRIGGYEILTEINRGGMGQVLLARKSGVHRFEKLVALKVIRSDRRRDLELRTMFLDEARLMARLTHPAITQVHDFGEWENLLYLVMEYVPGVSFRELIRRRPPPMVAAWAVAEACQGLHAAHELRDRSGSSLGVVHRDVSPENLLLTFDGRVKILDFGIALMRDRETPRTEMGQIKGKPAYMAPEQIKNQPADRRSDVFSAAVVLHELLTGRRLFTGDSIYAVAKAVEESDIPAPSTLSGVLPAGLDAVVAQALQRDPMLRYPTALEMARDLERVIAESRGEDLVRFAERELRADREAHDAWLQEVVDGLVDDEARKPGRPDGVATAPLRKPVAAGRPPADDAGPSATALTVPSGASTGSPARRKKPAPWLVAAFVLLALGAGAFWLADRLSEETPPPAAPDPGPAVDKPPPAPPPDEPPVEAPGETTEDPALDETPAVKKPSPRVRRKKRRPPRRTEKDKPAPDAGPPAPAAVEPAPGFGTITVGADPWAMVWIDGRQAGPTPLIEHRVPAGEHEIKVLSPDNGAVRLRRMVRIPADGHREIVAP